jgi:predicted transposase/invertase (TIGR01784 family)
MNHDQLFKQLLTTFFYEFVELFLPDVAAYTDRDHLEFLDKEVFTDLTGGDRHEVDLVVKTRFRNEPTYFLVHVENESTPQPAFAKRMFRYFARLHE